MSDLGGWLVGDIAERKPPTACPCGHKLSMCHRENAARWCGSSKPRCDTPAPDLSVICDLFPGHDGPHMNAATSSEWRAEGADPGGR